MSGPGDMPTVSSSGRTAVKNANLPDQIRNGNAELGLRQHGHDLLDRTPLPLHPQTSSIRKSVETLTPNLHHFRHVTSVVVAISYPNYGSWYLGEHAQGAVSKGGGQPCGRGTGTRKRFRVIEISV